MSEVILLYTVVAIGTHIEMILPTLYTMQRIYKTMADYNNITVDSGSYLAGPIYFCWVSLKWYTLNLRHFNLYKAVNEQSRKILLLVPSTKFFGVL